MQSMGHFGRGHEIGESYTALSEVHRGVSWWVDARLEECLRKLLTETNISERQESKLTSQDPFPRSYPAFSLNFLLISS